MSILPSLARGSSSTSRCLVRLVINPSRHLHILTSSRPSFPSLTPSSSSSSSFLRHSSSRPAEDPTIAPPRLDEPEEDQEEDPDALPAPLSYEELQFNELKGLRGTLGRDPKGDEIPRDLVVRPFFPDDPRPRPPILYSSLLQSPEFKALQHTHTPVLVRLALGKPDDPNSYSIARIFDIQELAQKELDQRNKEKEVARAAALATKPGALGTNSGLRNQAHSKEFRGTWVMAENDLRTRVKQLRDHLLNSQKVSLELKPKTHGKKVKVSDEQKAEILEKVNEMMKDIAEKSQEDKTVGESTTLFFQPIKSVRDAVVKSEKLKIAEKVKKESEERAWKEKKKAAAAPGKAKKWRPGQPIPTADALSSTPTQKY